MVQGIRAVRSGMLPHGATEVVESTIVAIPKPIATVWREVWGGYRALGTNRSWVRTHSGPPMRPTAANRSGSGRPLSSRMSSRRWMRRTRPKTNDPVNGPSQRWATRLGNRSITSAVSHSKLHAAPAKRGAAMRSAATGLSPAWSNSLASGGKSAAVAKPRRRWLRSQR